MAIIYNGPLSIRLHRVWLGIVLCLAKMFTLYNSMFYKTTSSSFTAFNIVSLIFRLSILSGTMNFLECIVYVVL